MEFCEGDVVEMARDVRKAFVAYKRRDQPRYQPSASRFGRVWEKAARILLETGITDVEGFVEAQFRELHNPYPNVLTNRTQALQRYETYKREMTDKGQAEVAVFSQMDGVMAQARRGLDMHKYLNNPLEELCPLIRYVVSVVMGFDDLAQALKDDALEYAREHPDVAAVVKARFPQVAECQQII